MCDRSMKGIKIIFYMDMSTKSRPMIIGRIGLSSKYIHTFKSGSNYRVSMIPAVI
jgi:hypothetical protein